MNKLTWGRSLTRLLIAAVAFLLISHIVGIIAQEQPQYPYNNTDRSLDTLAYVSENNELVLHDPHSRTETTLLNNVQSFKLGRDGRVAYTRVDETDTDLYVFNPSTPTLDPLNISETPNAHEYPLAWSPDGRYLAFESYEDSDEHSLAVWDGEKTVNIMPDEALAAAVRFYVDWSYDGRLVFNILYGWSNLDMPPETYIWDGSTTINVSQNPQGWDGVGSWSKDGQLMFGSQRDDVGDIYVWNGTSFKDDAPDVDTFIRLAPELEPESATWTDDGYVAFTLREAASSGTKEIVVWDLESETIIRRIRVSSDKWYSSLTSDGLMILSSQLASGIPSVYLDVEDTNGNMLLSIHTGEYSWSSSGYLAYCGIEAGMSRLLTIWNGEESWVVAQVSYRPAQWQNGSNTFSCNNG